MKRRSFVHLLAATPLVPAVAQNQEAGRSSAPGAAEPATAIEVTAADTVCESQVRFFTTGQSGTLRRLCEMLMPAGENPGAVEAGVPEFLDFLIGTSPGGRQQLYRE